MSKNNDIIYGVRIDDKYYYVGKTSVNNVETPLTKSDCGRQYSCENLRNIFINNDNVSIEPIKYIHDNNWYDQKLAEIVKYNPPLNAQWQLDGCRGYWQGKSKDKHTIDRLSECKHIKIVEYDIDGSYKKTWNSAKEIGINVLNDYKIINGSACSRIYQVIANKKIKRKKYNNSYWIRESELIAKYNVVPEKLNISEIIKEEKTIKRTSLPNRNNITKYSINEYNFDNVLINTYMNCFEAAEKLKISYQIVRRICRGVYKNPKFILKYGDKIPQPIVMRRFKQI